MGVVGARAKAAAEEEAPPPSGSSLAQTAFNLTKNIVGVGLLSLPAGIAAGTGLAPAVVITILLGVYSGYTFSLFGRVCASTGEHNFKGLGLAAGSPRLASFMTWSCVVRTAFSCLTFSIVMGDSFSAILRSLGAPPALAGRNAVLCGMHGFVLLPLCSMRDLSGLSYTSLLGTLGMVYTVGFMLLRSLDGCYAPGGRFFRAAASSAGAGEPAVWAVNLSTLVLVSALSTACSAHYNAPRYWEQLRERSVPRFNAAIALSFGVAVGMCLVAMCAGYLTFGTSSQGFILNNYSTADPLATIARICISSSIVCTYPLAFTGLRDGVMSLLGLATDRRTFQTVTVSLLGVIMFFSLAIRNAAFVVNLAGAFFGGLIVYIFPALLLYLLHKKRGGRGRFEPRFALATMAWGVLLTLLGSTIAVVQEFAPARLRP